MEALWAGLTHEQFWDYDMEEVLEVVETYQRLLKEEDAKLAHYAHVNFAAQVGKKAPKADKLKRIREPHEEEFEARKVVSIEEQRRMREKLREAIRERNAKRSS